MVDLANSFILLANFVLIPALTYGCQLALGALGVTLVFGILRFSNFAHGDTMAFGTMVTILATWSFQSFGWSFGPLPTALFAIPVGVLGTIFLTLVTDKIIYKHYRRGDSKPIIFVIASVGIMFVFGGLVRLIIGPGNQSFSDGERFIFRAREFKEWSGLNEGLALKTSQGLTVIMTVILALSLFWFLKYTRTGKAMRAYSDNEKLALLSGVDPDKVVKLTWIITAILATVAGVLYGLDKSFMPFTYSQLLLPIFAAAIVGGLGNPMGAVAGGFIVSFSEIGITYAYRKFFKYLLPDETIIDGQLQLLSTDYKYAVSFLILVLVLLLRPTGLFKGAIVR